MNFDGIKWQVHLIIFIYLFIFLSVNLYRLIIPFFAANSLHCHCHFITHFNYLKIVLTFIELSTHSCYMLRSVSMFILNEYDDDNNNNYNYYYYRCL